MSEKKKFWAKQKNITPLQVKLSLPPFDMYTKPETTEAKLRTFRESLTQLYPIRSYMYRVNICTENMSENTRNLFNNIPNISHTSGYDLDYEWTYM
jgi:hypothetical protein